MEIRDLNLRDYITLEKLHDKVSEFPIPNPSNKLNIVKKAIYDDGNFIGAGFAWNTTEISLIVDDDLSSIKRAKAVKLLFDTLLKELVGLGYEDSHVFVIPKTDVKYAELLKKHFGFIDDEGIPLYYRKKV